MESTTVRVLGAAVLFVFFASLVIEQLQTAAVGKTNFINLLAVLSRILTTLRLSNVVALVNSLGIVVLAVHFERVLIQQNSALAMITLACGPHQSAGCGCNVVAL